MGESTFKAFEDAARARGFDAVLERRWSPNTVLATHTPTSAARAVQGEMWLTVGEHTQHLRAGDRFELDSQVPHAERYGGEVRPTGWRGAPRAVEWPIQMPPMNHLITPLAAKPTKPKPSARKSTKVPKRPAFDSRASCKMMNTM